MIKKFKALVMTFLLGASAVAESLEPENDFLALDNEGDAALEYDHQNQSDYNMIELENENDMQALLEDPNDAFSQTLSQV
ncbi:MAG: hypothetical protein Q8K36_01230 [Alphaproteobacteria bacterium]|nr:hypothetical protein [Alphaproteobacteria bacterium]